MGSLLLPFFLQSCGVTRLLLSRSFRFKIFCRLTGVRGQVVTDNRLLDMRGLLVPRLRSTSVRNDVHALCSFLFAREVGSEVHVCERWFNRPVFRHLLHVEEFHLVDVLLRVTALGGQSSPHQPQPLG